MSEFLKFSGGVEFLSVSQGEFSLRPLPPFVCVVGKQWAKLERESHSGGFDLPLRQKVAGACPNQSRQTAETNLSEVQFTVHYTNFEILTASLTSDLMRPV